MRERSKLPFGAGLVLLLTACGGGGTTPGCTIPAVAQTSGTVQVPAAGGTVTLPTQSGDVITAMFPALSVQTSVAVTDYTGLSGDPSPNTNMWSPNAPIPLEEIQMVFPTSMQLATTPSITMTSTRVSGLPYYYDVELYDADANPVGVIAQEQATTSNNWPAQGGILPAMYTSWNIIAGHRYVFEIVPSTATTTTCTSLT